MRLNLTYQDLEDMADKVALQAFREQFDGMLIITRGGLIPGYLLATRLKIRNIQNISLQSYEGYDKQGELKEVDGIVDRKFDDNVNWLIVDDISDSGKTLKYVVDKYFSSKTNYKVATLLMRTSTEFRPDYCAEEVKNEAWIVFPYEQD